MATAGRSDLGERLDPARFRHMVDLIDRIADLALAQGITPVIHQHAGCYIEFEDEIERVMAALDPERVGLCIDTGHMAYAGIDPVAFYERHAPRVKYFHFKDIDREGPCSCARRARPLSRRGRAEDLRAARQGRGSLAGARRGAVARGL